MSTTAMKTGSQPSGTGGAAGPGGALVLAGAQGGLALIPQPTALTRLNYFDGKFLRADDLRVEQDYLRNLVWLSNRAGGSGVVSGLDLVRRGGTLLDLTPGLAIDPRGRVLSLPHAATVDVVKLVEASRQAASTTGTGGANGTPGFAECVPATATPPGGGVAPADLYLVVAYHAEALCGQEDVYGKLCEDACVTSTDRPYRLEGIVLRAVPLALGPALCTAPWLTRRHWRSQVASRCFADERARLGRAMSGVRLRQELWCRGAEAEAGDGVPLAVVSLSGGALEFVDGWSARRERMADPPVRWWQWQTGMRPLAVFWAQVLQFQCQLADVVGASPTPGGEEDPCARQYTLLRQTQEMLGAVERQFREATARVFHAGSTEAAGAAERVDASARIDAARLEAFRPDFVARVADLHADVRATLTQIDAGAVTRVLIDRGITELPPAGWLPVAPGPLDVNTQVRRLMGEGVDLRFCAVRPDYTAHAFEEAQHLERICLLQGLSDPNDLPEVDVLVPDGTVLDPAGPAAGVPGEATVVVKFPQRSRDRMTVTVGDTLTLAGAARAERLPGGGGALHFAAQGEVVPASQTATRVDFTPAMGFASFRRSTAADASSEARAEEAVAAGTGGTASASATGAAAVAQRFVNSVWATLRTDGDPFALRPGDATPLRGDLAMTFEDDGVRRVGELHLQGELACDTGGGGLPRLTGRATGFAAWAQPGRPTESTWQDAPVEVALVAHTGGGTALTFTFTGPEFLHVTLTASWFPAPVLAEAEAKVDWIQTTLDQLIDEAAGDTAKIAEARRKVKAMEEKSPGLRALPLASARMRENAAVALPGNDYHDRAVQALAALEALLDRPGFRQAGETRLFPAPRPASEPRRILATRDWVLFHRRRRSSCDCQCHPAPALAARRYRVYHARVPFDAGVDDARKLVLGLGPIDGLQTLGVLPEFVQGGGTLATARGAVLEAWKQLHPGESILYGAVCGAGAGAADPPAVHDARLEAVSSIADDVTPDAHAAYEVLQSIPPALPAGGVDGVIVLVTTERVTTVCHQVFRLNRGTYLAQVQKLYLANELQAALPKVAKPLGIVTFQEGTDTPVGDVTEIRKAWDALGAMKSGQAATFSPAPESGPLRESQLRQASFIQKTLGGATVASFGPAGTPIASGCDVVTLVAEEMPIPCQSLWRLDDGPPDAAGVPRLQRFALALQADDVNAALLQVPGLTKLIDLRFSYLGADFMGDPSVIKGAWTPATDAIGQVVTASMGTPLPDETAALHGQRSQTIATALAGAVSPSTTFATFTSAKAFSCSAITLLVHPVPVEETCATVLRLVDVSVGGVPAETLFRQLMDRGSVTEALRLAPVVGTVPFTKGNPALSAAAVAALKAAVGSAAPLRAFSVFTPMAVPADRAWFHQERDAVANALKPGLAINDDCLAMVSVPLPGCPSMVVVVVQQQTVPVQPGGGGTLVTPPGGGGTVAVPPRRGRKAAPEPAPARPARGGKGKR